MPYHLKLLARDGQARTFTYDPTVSLLTDETGAPLAHPLFVTDPKPTFSEAPRVSPETPLGKGGRNGIIHTLKIQMGFRCNYACGYCNQASHAHVVGGDMADTRAFLDALPEWPLSRIEFWGGEPLVYFSRLRVLVPELRRRYPTARFNMITNGSLLDDEKVDFLLHHRIGVGISHDGPAQNLRHPEDILDDPEKCRLIRRLVHEGDMGFGCVLTRFNYSIAAVRRHIEGKLDLPPGTISLNTEEILLPYDTSALMCLPYGEAEFSEALHTLFWEAATGQTVPGCNSVRAKIEDFFRSLGQARPLAAVGQKCGMDRTDTVAIDLKGNVTTCHNTAADGRHRIGHVSDMAAVSLDTAWHHSTRAECRSCPVVQLCKGSCMFLDGKLFEAACDASFTYNLAMLAAALYFAFDLVLTGIEGSDPMRAGRTPTHLDVIDPETLQ